MENALQSNGNGYNSRLGRCGKIENRVKIATLGNCGFCVKECLGKSSKVVHSAMS